jgi:hypothetical protein
VNLYKNSVHKVGLQLGGLLRYQTSSYYDAIDVLYPALTGLPIPVTIIINKTPQKTFSIGSTAQFYHTYSVKKCL